MQTLVAGDCWSDVIEGFNLAMARISPSEGIIWETPHFNAVWSSLDPEQRARIEAGTDQHTLQYASDIYTVHIRRDGEILNVLLLAEPLNRTSITRYLADREALLLTSRSLSVGEMASTLAHELNQPLGSISNLLQVLKLKLSKAGIESDDLADVIDKALIQVGYSTGIIARIREYVEQRKPRREATQLGQLLSDSAGLLDWELARYDITLEIDVPANMPTVMVDRIMLQQVVTNLARNGIEAMRSKSAKERMLLLRVTHDRNEVDIIIRDTGHGMSEEKAAKLFTPFFSTKSSGMGIGLNICRSIVELHGGSLWHESGPGGGMSFHVTLPLLADEGTS